MRQANGIGATPWDELELNDPVQLGHGLVLLFPVAVQAHALVVEFVDHQDVRSHLALAVLVVFEFQVDVDVVDLAHAVVVVFPLLALDLVVGLLWFGGINFHGRLDQVDVLVHAVSDAALELPVGDLVHFGCALGGVEVAGSERQDHTVNWQELHAWAFLLLIKPQLEILRAAQWQLGQQLFLFVAELFDLLGDLPVQVVTLAL